MKVRFHIYFRCAERGKVFSAARSDALETRGPANSRTCSETTIPAAILPRSVEQDAEHVLTGARDLVGAARREKTSVRDKNREPFEAHDTETWTDHQA